MSPNVKTYMLWTPSMPKACTAPEVQRSSSSKPCWHLTVPAKLRSAGIPKHVKIAQAGLLAQTITITTIAVVIVFLIFNIILFIMRIVIKKHPADPTFFFQSQQLELAVSCGISCFSPVVSSHGWLQRRGPPQNAADPMGSESHDCGAKNQTWQNIESWNNIWFRPRIHVVSASNLPATLPPAGVGPRLATYAQVNVVWLKNRSHKQTKQWCLTKSILDNGNTQTQFDFLSGKLSLFAWKNQERK